MKYLIFSFLRFGIKAKRSGGFRYSTLACNASRMAENGDRNVNTKLPVSALLHAGYSVKLRDKNTLFYIKEYRNSKLLLENTPSIADNSEMLNYDIIALPNNWSTNSVGPQSILRSNLNHISLFSWFPARGQF